MALPSLHYQIAPLSSNESAPHPALILLHGRGTDENDLLNLTPYFDPRVLIAAIRAPYQFPLGGFTWFDLDLPGEVNIDQFLESQNALFQCIETLKEIYALDASRIFLFGFSMGAMMALTMSLLQPAYFKGIIAHSGLLLKHTRLAYQWNNHNPVSYFIAHGEYDPIVPVTFGRNAYTQLSTMKATVEYREYPIQHTICEDSLRDMSKWLLKHI